MNSTHAPFKGTMYKVNIILNMVGVQDELHPKIFKTIFEEVGKTPDGSEIYTTSIPFKKLKEMNIPCIDYRYREALKQNDGKECARIIDMLKSNKQP